MRGRDKLHANRQSIIAKPGRKTNRGHPGVGGDRSVRGERHAWVLAFPHIFFGRRRDLNRRKGDSRELVLGENADNQALEAVAAGELSIIVRITFWCFRSSEYVDKMIKVKSYLPAACIVSSEFIGMFGREARNLFTSYLECAI
jgi:hypothetical protein